MSGTSSRTSSSTSALGMRSKTYCERGSTSSESPGADRGAEQRLGEAHDALLVGVADDERALAVLEDLLEHDDLAGRSNSRASTTFSASLSRTSWPGRRSRGRRRRGCTTTRILRPAGEDVDRAVVERLEEDAVAAGRLGEAVDLLLERDDLVAGLAEGGDEALVLRLAPRRARPASGGSGARRSSPVSLGVGHGGHLPRLGVVCDPTHVGSGTARVADVPRRASQPSRNPLGACPARRPHHRDPVPLAVQRPGQVGSS